MRRSSLLLVAVAALALLAALTHDALGIKSTRVLPSGTPASQTAELSYQAKVIVLGDSISVGAGAPRDQTWPTMFATRLGATLVNLAGGGDTSSRLISQPLN